MADILLQSGGFRLIAVDLSGIPERVVRKVPLSSWFRFSRVIEKQSAALVFIAQEPHATSCAGLVLRVGLAESGDSASLTRKSAHAIEPQSGDGAGPGKETRSLGNITGKEEAFHFERNGPDRASPEFRRKNSCSHAFTFPILLVQASLLPEPAETRTALQQSPLALLDGPANLPRVFATNAAARRAGIQTGMAKLQVETYGGVLLRKRSIAAEESAQSSLLDFAGRFSPRVESTCPGAAILDLAGMEKLLRMEKKFVAKRSPRHDCAGS